uniref:Uncharacterized protein n=1 Tax=Vespula pensylvanica TaxID=30213 RepID=A0A834KU40_VESPE|nr:hypothetical protein H0235_012749 [Vespula pensylvanica]
MLSSQSNNNNDNDDNNSNDNNSSKQKHHHRQGNLLTETHLRRKRSSVLAFTNRHDNDFCPNFSHGVGGHGNARMELKHEDSTKRKEIWPSTLTVKGTRVATSAAAAAPAAPAAIPTLTPIPIPIPIPNQQ